MASTDDDFHKLEVQSTAAKAVANEILDTLNVRAEEVRSMEVRIESVNQDGEETETVLQSTGPSAGVVSRPMLASVDWGNETPRLISVSVHTEDGEEGEVEEGEVEEGEDLSDRVVEVDSGFRAGTNAHIALTAIAAYIYKRRQAAQETSLDGGDWDWGGEKPGVTARMIYDKVDVSLDFEQLSDSLRYLDDRGFLDRVSGEEKGGINYYHVNDEGWELLNEVGPSDEVEEFPTDELLKSRHRVEKHQFATREIDERGREDPYVDKPVPVGKGTQAHEALTILSRMADEYGEDHWVTAEGVYRFPSDIDWTSENAASAVLSDLFLEHALCERKPDDEKGKQRCLYRINRAGAAELNRLNEADV